MGVLVVLWVGSITAAKGRSVGYEAFLSPHYRLAPRGRAPQGRSGKNSRLLRAFTPSPTPTGMIMILLTDVFLSSNLLLLPTVLTPAVPPFRSLPPLVRG